jgi:hypothetical protein
MAAITPTPLFMKDALVRFGTDSYEAAVRDVKFVPSASVVTTRALAPAAVYSNVDVATWTLEMTYLQDWVLTTSLARYLYANEGTTVTLTFEPITGGATITASVVITPGAIGGAVGAYAESTVTLPSSKPAFTDPV